MSSEPLTAEWFEEAAGTFSSSFAVEKVQSVVSLAVSGAPTGEVVCTWTFAGGAPQISLAAGSHADLVMTIDYKTFLRVLSGELSPAVAYMQGLLKSSGDMGLMLDVIAGSNTEEFSVWRGTFAA